MHAVPLTLRRTLSSGWSVGVRLRAGLASAFGVSALGPGGGGGGGGGGGERSLS